MAVETRRMTVAEFDEYAALPENAGLRLEFIGGDIVEAPSAPFVSEIAVEIAFRIKVFLNEQGLRGHVTSEGGGYMVSGERYAPDVAFISHERQPELARQGYNPNPPELAVEVISPSDIPSTLTTKIGNYLAAGAIVWVINPDTRDVRVFAPGEPVKTLDLEDTLDGGSVLPGFTLPVKAIFPTPSSD